MKSFLDQMDGLKRAFLMFEMIAKREGPEQELS